MNKYIWKFASLHQEEDKIELFEYLTNIKYCSIKVDKFCDLLSEHQYELFKVDRLKEVLFLKQELVDNNSLTIYSVL